MSTQILSNKLTRLNAILAMVFTTLFAVQAHAMFGFEPYYKFGAVYTRSIVVDPSTNMPIWVEYDETGREANVIGGMQDGDFTFSGTEYRAYHDQYTQIMETMPDAIWMSVYDYLAQPEYLAYNDETFAPVEINPDYDNVQFVLVRSKAQTQIADGEHHLLARFPVDIRQPVGGDYASLLLRTDPASGEVSAIITPAEPDYNIGFRVKFFGPEGDDTGEEALDGVDANTYRKATDVIYGPIKGARITTTPAARISDGAETGEDGKYSMHYTLPPCPGFTFSYTTPAYLELQYNRFNPRLPGYRIYWQQRIDYDFCNGLAATAPAAIAPTIIGILASAATPIKRPRDFPIDIMVINGHARLENPDGSGVDVTPELGDIQSVFALDNFSKSATAPAYDLSVPSFVRQTQSYYDFDKDGTFETTVLGRVVEVPVEGGEEGETEKLFFPQTDQDYPCVTSRDQPGELCSHQGVYLSSTGNLPAESQPDILRIADWGLDDDSEFQDKGLATEMGEIDLSNTDLYIFRESNGELIAERRGLNTAETNASTKGLQGAADGRFFYTLEMRGPREGIYSASYLRRNPVDPATGNPVGPQNAYRFWQQQSGVVEKFWNREADHLRPGERIRIIAINRVTGYMGSVTTELKAHSNTDTDDNGDTIERNAMMIDYSVNDIVMRPPNLKVWAERSYTVEQGLTRGTQYLGDDARDPTDDSQKAAPVIGFEGAGLGTDTAIVVYTEWLDQDGRALPEALGDYGYTARFAKIVAPNQLDDAAVGQADDGSGAVAQFPIKPGKHTSVIRFSNPNSNREHLYIHVSGQPYTRQADFEQLQVFQSTDTSTGMQESRPDRYVPIKVPVYNEDQSLQAQKTYRDYVAAQGEDADITTPKPEPIYEWLYRPEFQFSVYDLTEQEIRRQVYEDEIQETYTAEKPMISSTDELIAFAYNLLSRDINSDGLDNDTLNAFSYDGNRELVVALGEEEVLATIGADQTITFENLDALSSLDPEDFLSMRLYSNNDAANVLMEWAFDLIAIFPAPSPEVIEIVADDSQEIGFSAIYLSKVEDPTIIKWGVETVPSGETVTFTPPINSSNEGVHFTLANLPTKADTKVRVYAVAPNDPDNRVYSATYEIKPGEPSEITYEISGEMAVAGIGQSVLTLDVKDEYGNAVEDGTPVKIQAGDIELEGSRLTVDGKIELAMTSGFATGTRYLIVQSGDVTEVVQAQVHDVDLSISMQSEIGVGSTVPVTISATSGYSNLSDIVVDVSAIRASVPSKAYQLNSNGTVTINAYVGEFTGEGRVFASLGDQLVGESFTVVETSDVQLLDNVIVSGVSGKGSITVDDTVFEYTGQTSLVVNGEAGETVTASLVDYLAPPMLPYLQFPLQRNVNLGQVDDIVIGYKADVSNVQRQSNYFGVNRYAYQINEEGYINVNYELFNSVTNPGFVFNFNPTKEGLLLEHSGLGITLTLDASQQLLMSYSDGTETVSVTAPNVTSNAWHRIGAHIVAGQLVLQVDDTTYKSSESISVGLPTSSNIRIGGEAEGYIADLSMYDWDAAKLATFDDGALEKSVTIDSTGKGVLSLNASAADVFADARQRRFDYWKDKVSSPYMLVAYAAEGECNPIDETSLDSFGEAIHMGAEYSRFLADCEYLPKLKKAYIKLQTSEGVKEKIVAVAQLSFYTAQYFNAKKAQLALVLGPQCLEGAITGNVENFASATCDIITSFFLIGDLRDFALHSKYQYWDSDQSKFDYPVYVFSGLGIAASLASLGGVGIPANAAIAGMKAGAKVMDGPFMTAMAKHLNDEIGGDFLNFDKIRTTLNVTLPILQITAAGVLYRTEFAAAYDAISSIRADQILGVMKYTKVALQQLASEYVAYNDYPGHQNAFGLEFAYAIDKDGIVKLLGGNDDAAADAIKKLVRLMSETQEKVKAGNLPGAKIAPNSYIRDLFVGGIAKFGKNIDEISNDQILEIVANDKFMTAMVIAQDIGKTAGRAEAEMVEAIRRFRCISGPGECTMGGVAQGKDGMIEFFGFFEKLADAQAAGKISDQAWGSISKVITQMGVNAATDSTQAFNKSKGATQNLAEIALKLGDEGVELVAAEKKYDIIVDGVKVGGREYDNVFRINGLEVGREVKDWDPENIVDILWDHYFNGVGKTKKGDPTAAGQLYLDALELLNKGAHNDLTKVDKEWAFSKGDPSAIVDGLIEKITADNSKLKAIVVASGDADLISIFNSKDIDLIEGFIEGEFKDMLLKLIVNTKSI